MTPVVDLYRKLLVGDDAYQASLISNRIRERKHKRRHQHNHNKRKVEQIQITDDDNDGIRMMVYSGDDDSVCSLAGTQTWIWDLLGDGPTSNPNDKVWQPWTLDDDGQIAGYVTQFDMTSHYNSHVGVGTKDDATNINAVVKSFSFITIRSAGHEVPLYRPKQALEMLRKFLHNEW